MAGSLGRPVLPPPAPLAGLTGERHRPLQTHLVASGRLKHSGWRDGDVIRHLATDEIVAEYRRGAWSRPVREARESAPLLYPAPVFPAVTVTLDKGRYY